MAGKYEIWLTNDKGTRLEIADDIVSMSASKVVNRIGSLSLVLPADFDDDLLKADNMIQVRRAATGASAFATWQVYFIRKWRYETTEDSQRIKVLTAYDPNHLLSRRIVAAYAGSTEAEKSDYADDMMKEIVSEAMLDTADPTPDAGSRAWDNLSVQAESSEGPSISKSFSWRELMTMSGGGLLPALAQAAKEAGTKVFFAIVPNSITATRITFEFRTYVGQPGRDVSDRVVFSESNANLKEPFLEFDYSEEKNYIYAAGQGHEDDRTVEQVYDSGRYGRTIWARCEGFADARNQNLANGVREAGRAALEIGRPIIRFGGSPQDTSGTRFGRDWEWGDLVKARYGGYELETVVRSVTLTIDDDGRERIDANFENKL